MKDQISRYLPILIGLLIGLLAGWMLVSPPDLLGPSLLVRATAVLLLAVLGPLVLFIFLIAANLPARIKLTPIKQQNVTNEMMDVFLAYQQAGFKLAGQPLRVGTSPPAVLVPLVDDQEPMYGTIFRTTTAIPKTSCDIVSILEPYGVLTTSAAPEGAALPSAPGAFFQVFPEKDVATLRTRHVEALNFLRRAGVRVKPVSGESFPEDFRTAITTQRHHFLSNPVWHTIVTVWRSVTGTSPHIGPVRAQSAARRTMNRFQQRVD